MQKNSHDMKTIQLTYQQGDLLMRRIEKLPDGPRKVINKGKCVLAHGESGHSHVVEDDDAELVQIGEMMLLTITNPNPVKHEEHHHRTIAPGIWEIGRVREYDWFSKMTRQVID